MSSPNVAATHAAPGSPWLRASYDADASVIIVTYNTRAMLDRALETLIGTQQHCSLEIIVIDNGSTDGTREMMAARYPRARYVANPRNLGHSGGCNQGMRLATGRYLFLLNSDTIILTEAVATLVDYLDANPRVGAVGSRVLNINGTVQGSVKSLPTPMAALFGRHSPLTRLFPGNPLSRRYLVYLDQDFSRPFAAGSVSGCALMVRRETVARAGPLDERLFYWNDVDWCRAIWEAGFEVHCVPASVIIHDEHNGGSRAGRKRSLRSIIDFHRGAYRYYRKWHARSPWSPANAAALVGLTVRAAVVLATEEVRWAIHLGRTWG
jgi:N-acetylglucosaminyl-diphospho-decaprenol L-rhamnosyltransferase